MTNKYLVGRKIWSSPGIKSGSCLLSRGS